MLLGAGIWFTWSLRAIQLRNFGHMFTVMGSSLKEGDKGISPFQALCTSLAARVGTGNLAGVAVAISLGGPGAIFWMWVIAILGMATGFVESTLAQLYKVKDADGNFRGGPAYYIQQGLNKRWLALLFSVCIFFGYGFIFSGVQANSISDALNHAYGIEPLSSGVVVALLAAIIVHGGMRSIARFAAYVVPFMGLAYLAVVAYVIVLNYELVPGVLYDIIASAFGFQEAAGGTMGAALMHGVRRGLYSNEAGAGSVPQAAAAAQPYPPHPVSQGYVQMLGVFIDTLVLCTCTAVIILLAGYGQSTEMEGVRLTQDALSSHVGAWGVDFIAIAICFFSFTSVVANYAYAESNLHMFKADNKLCRNIFTISYLLSIVYCSQAVLPVVWAMADMALGFMTLINVTAIVMLTGTVVALAKHYHQQREAGKLPTLNKAEFDAYKGDIEEGVWVGQND